MYGRNEPSVSKTLGRRQITSAIVCVKHGHGIRRRRGAQQLFALVRRRVATSFHCRRCPSPSRLIASAEGSRAPFTPTHGPYPLSQTRYHRNASGVTADHPFRSPSDAPPFLFFPPPLHTRPATAPPPTSSVLFFLLFLAATISIRPDLRDAHAHVSSQVHGFHRRNAAFRSTQFIYVEFVRFFFHTQTYIHIYVYISIICCFLFLRNTLWNSVVIGALFLFCFFVCAHAHTRTYTRAHTRRRLRRVGEKRKHKTRDNSSCVLSGVQESEWRVAGEETPFFSRHHYIGGYQLKNTYL